MGSAITLSFLMALATADATEASAQKTQAPLYRVEVLVFERLDERLRDAEHWPDTTLALQFPEKYHDPFSPPVCRLAVQDDDLKPIGTDTSADNGTRLGITEDGTIQGQKPLSVETETLWQLWQPPKWLSPSPCPEGYNYLTELKMPRNTEDPSMPLETTHENADDMLAIPVDGYRLVEGETLVTAYQKIRTRRNVKILHYSSWLQPFPPNSPTQHFRLIGGKDYGDEFSLVGLPISSAEPQTVIGETTEQAPLITAKTDDKDAYANSEMNSDQEKELEPSPLTTVLEQPEIQSISHLWELDGWLTLYRKRYLHVELNLQLREPAEREVDIIHDMMPDTEDPLADTTRGLNWQFQWDELTTSEDQPKTTEKVTFLRGYTIQQQRRLRSKELHYFDHPLAGVLILITPVTVETQTTESEEDNSGH